MFSVNSPVRAYADDDCDESTATPTATVTATPTASATPTATATPTGTPTTGAIDLGLGGVVSATDPKVGAEFTYTLTLANEAAVASVAGVRVFVPAVAGVTNSDFAGAGWSLVSQDADGAIYEYSAVVAAGGSAEPLVLTLTPTTAGDYTLEANIVTGTGGDTVTSNNTTSANITVAVPAAPDMTVKMTSLDDLYRLGGYNPITFEVSNVGTASTSGLITLYVPKPSHQLGFVVDSMPSGWTLAEETADGYTFTTTKVMAAGASDSFVIKFGTSIVLNSYEFSATVFDGSGGEANNTNNSDTLILIRPVV